MFDFIICMLDNVLVHTKSGSLYPRNIADFMPDYNLWYALKFCGPKTVVIVDNPDLSSRFWSSLDTPSYQTRISFIRIWLSQMTGIKTSAYFSTRGNWQYLGWDDKDMVDLISTKNDYKESKNPLFIDSNDKKSEELISKKGINYMTKDEFIEKYNPNPREYTKRNEPPK